MPKHALTWVFLCRLAVSTVVIVATELTIYWNNLSGVYELGSAGQLIPLVLGSMMLVHTLYRWIRPSREDDSDGERSRLVCASCYVEITRERAIQLSRRRKWRGAGRGHSHVGP